MSASEVHTSFELNICSFCGEQLGLDDFDGLCADCDESVCAYCEQIIPIDERAYSTEVCRKCCNAGVELLDLD